MVEEICPLDSMKIWDPRHRKEASGKVVCLSSFYEVDHVPAVLVKRLRCAEILCKSKSHLVHASTLLCDWFEYCIWSTRRDIWFSKTK